MISRRKMLLSTLAITGCLPGRLYAAPVSGPRFLLVFL